MAQVSLSNLTKSYGETKVLHGIHLDIQDGEFAVLVGPSGCGKSTTLRIVAGLEEASGGDVYIGDVRVNDVEPKNRDIAMVFQNYALYPHMNVYENMAFGLRLRKYSDQEIKERVEEAADILSVEEYLYRRPKELSGGQRQRVAVGRAIVRKPSVFLFDEPLSNLDAKLRVQMRTEIKKLHARLKTTMIYVTHDQVEAMTMGHRIAVLNQGRLQQLGTPMELYRWPSNLFVAQFIGSPPMNVLPVTVASAGTLLLGERRLPVEGALADALPALEGQHLNGGIRPEQLRIAPATNRNLPADVSHSEVLGNEQLITCRLLDGGHLIQVRADPDLDATPGSRVHLEAEPTGWRLFDRLGEAIARPHPPRSSENEPLLPNLG